MNSNDPKMEELKETCCVNDSEDHDQEDCTVPVRSTSKDHEDRRSDRESNFGEEFAKMLSKEGSSMFGELMKKLGIDPKMVEDATNVFKTVTESFSTQFEQSSKENGRHERTESTRDGRTESPRNRREGGRERRRYTAEEINNCCPMANGECEPNRVCEWQERSACPMTAECCNEDCVEECVNRTQENSDAEDHRDEEAEACSHLECSILSLLDSASQQERHEALEYLKPLIKPKFNLSNLNVAYMKNKTGYRVRLVFDMSRLEAVHHLIEYISL